MNNVYLDLLFLINFFTDYIALLCTAKISKTTILRGRFCLSAFVGGIYACACILFRQISLDDVMMRFIVAALLCMISFYHTKHFLKCYMIFIIISSIFGGLLSPFLFDSSIGTDFLINIKTLILLFSVMNLLLSFLCNSIKLVHTNTYHEIRIILNNRCVTITALNDTGNELVDPISNLPVIIIDQKLTAELIPEYELKSANEDIYSSFCRLNQLNQYAGKIRLIPCHTISGKDLLIGVVPERVYIDGKAENRIIAFSKYEFNHKNQYQGVS